MVGSEPRRTCDGAQEHVRGDLLIHKVEQGRCEGRTCRVYVPKSGEAVVRFRVLIAFLLASSRSEEPDEQEDPYQGSAGADRFITAFENSHSNESGKVMTGKSLG